MPKIWKVKEKISQDVGENIIRVLSENPHPASGHLPPEGEGIEGLLVQLLYNRGLTDKKQIEEFLDSRYEKLHSPFLFLDMQKAVDRIWKGIDQGEKICIYGDYDADAVTANAVLQQTFRYFGVEVLSYIPDRFTEGYGINLNALQKIKDDGIKIIITVDCGTNSIDAAEFCKQNGIDLIITDHHEIIGPKPEAYALVNPKNPDDAYPDPNITGVGVAFKLATAILAKNVGAGLGRPLLTTGAQALPLQTQVNPEWVKWLLDLVAIGTVADCHSLTGENRIFVKYGLKVLAKTKWPGLRALIQSSGLDFSQKPPDTYSLGFVIAPRLNAAGRLEHADAALHLLMSKDLLEAQTQAANLEAINKRRQDQTARIVSEAKEQAMLIQGRKIIVVAGEGWNRGIVGLVAGRLAEEFYKPVIVLEKTESFCTGSARTAGEFDIIEALKSASDYLVRFGGHKQAAGLTLETKNLDIFYQALLDYADKNIVEENFAPILYLEAELEEKQLSIASCQLLQQLEPFGIDNPKPKFLISDMKIISSRQVGAKQQHSQMQLQKGASTIAAIAFNFVPLEKNFKLGDTVDVAAELMEDGWNGRKEVKLRVVDMRNQSNN